MRNRSSKQSNNIRAMDQIDGSVPNYKKLLKEEDQEPHLSGAYIRSLVKQLTSSRTKTTSQINPSKTTDIIDQDHHGLSQNLNKISSEISHQNPQPQQPKKQVRRRLHTSRPYQERLLNMAEARREIVTALKFHRAAMKQANEQQQQQKQEESSQESKSQSFPSSSVLDHHQQQQEESMNSGRNINPKIYSSNININSFSSYFDNLSYSTQPNSNIFPWMASSIAPILPITENLNLPLPNQPLGLNLNFQDFTNLDNTSLYHSNINNNNNQYPSIYNSHPSPSSTSSPPMSSVEDALPVAILPEGMATMTATDVIMDSGFATGGLHPEMDDEEMAEIRSIGEQHQMEWNDRLNFVTSAWWFKLMKTMEIDYPMEKKDEKLEELDDGFHVFDEIMEFPTWMNNANDEGCFLQQHLDDHFSEDYLQEPALPCMDIGEIEGMDGEWLA